MLRRLVGGMAFLCAMAASAQMSSGWAIDARMMPMQFELRREGPADVCGDRCRLLLAATGAVTRDTPTDFEAFARDHDVRGAIVVLNSSGGSVLGALDLGRSIRRLGLTTTVGKTVEIPARGSENARFSVSPRADCESMCAFLLLGGTQRFVPAEAHVLVHEIWLGDRREDATAANYTAEDLAIVQRDIGRLAQYTIEMGGSIDLLETALRIPPWEPMRRLTDIELRRMGLDTGSTVPDQAAPQPTTVSAKPAAKVTQASESTERGWAAVEKSGSTTLNRRHPLTVEGDRIGSFDLVIACGKSPDAYNVTYTEQRSAQGRSAAEPLKQVSISVGRREVALQIVTSEARAKPGELDTLARGVLPAALVRALASESSRSVTITTSAPNNVGTAIRMGNTGVALNFPKLAATCGEPVVTPRPDARAELLPGKTGNIGGHE